MGGDQPSGKAKEVGAILGIAFLAFSAQSILALNALSNGTSIPGLPLWYPLRWLFEVAGYWPTVMATFVLGVFVSVWWVRWKGGFHT